MESVDDDGLCRCAGLKVPPKLSGVMLQQKTQHLRYLQDAKGNTFMLVLDLLIAIAGV
jgi:hypothetical protein